MALFENGIFIHELHQFLFGSPEFQRIEIISITASIVQTQHIKPCQQPPGLILLPKIRVKLLLESDHLFFLHLQYLCLLLSRKCTWILKLPRQILKDMHPNCRMQWPLRSHLLLLLLFSQSILLQFQYPKLFQIFLAFYVKKVPNSLNLCRLIVLVPQNLQTMQIRITLYLDRDQGFFLLGDEGRHLHIRCRQGLYNWGMWWGRGVWLGIPVVLHIFVILPLYLKGRKRHQGWLVNIPTHTCHLPHSLLLLHNLIPVPKHPTPILLLFQGCRDEFVAFSVWGEIGCGLEVFTLKSLLAVFRRGIGVTVLVQGLWRILRDLNIGKVVVENKAGSCWGFGIPLIIPNRCKESLFVIMLGLEEVSLLTASLRLIKIHDSTHLYLVELGHFLWGIIFRNTVSFDLVRHLTIHIRIFSSFWVLIWAVLGCLLHQIF